MVDWNNTEVQKITECSSSVEYEQFLLQNYKPGNWYYVLFNDNVFYYLVLGVENYKVEVLSSVADKNDLRTKDFLKNNRFKHMNWYFPTLHRQAIKIEE